MIYSHLFLGTTDGICQVLAHYEVIIMNKKTACITDEQFNEIITLLRDGDYYINPNKEMALILTITGNCGLRIGDCVRLRMNSFIKQGNDYMFNIHEEKTNKTRTNVIPSAIYELIKAYAKEQNKADNDLVFNYTVRAIQWKLKQVCDYLGYKDISTHSFRKCAGMRIYINSGNDIELTRKFLNHSSIAITQRYLRTDESKLNDIIKSSCVIPC